MGKNVYLCGAFYGDWKARVKEAVMNCQYYDPEIDGNQRAIVNYIGGDLAMIDGCDVIFAYLTSYPVYGGLAAEMGYAYAIGTPIIFVSDKDEVDGFLLGLSRWYCTNLDAGIVRLKKYIETKTRQNKKEPS